MAISQYHVCVCVEEETAKKKKHMANFPKNYATYRC